MADLVVTAGSVVPFANATRETGVAGATILAGQTVYKDPTTKKYLLADADSATASARTTRGIALNGASLDQPLVVHTGGGINPGATVVIGTVYAQSDVPGAIRPVADNGSGDYVTVIGVGVAVNRIDVNIQASGVAVP